MSIEIFYLILIIFGVSCVDIPSDYCRGITQGMRPHPDPTRCSEFVLCLYETPYLMSCERPNEIFYPPAGDCLPGYPETCELLTTTTIFIPTTTFTDKPVTTTITEESTSTSIPEETTTMTEESTTTTEEPITISTTTVTDEPVTTFSTTTEESTTTSSTLPPTTTSISEETTTSTTQQTAGPPEPCDGNHFRLIPNPDYCFRFYFCNFDTAVPYECAPDTIFSEQYQRCIDGDWDTCDPHTTTESTTSTTSTVTDNPTTTTEESTTTQRPTGPPELCVGKDFLFVPDPDYCYRFYFCMFGEASLYECAPDKIFSEESQGCIDGDWVTCVFYTTTEYPTTTTTITDEPITITTSTQSPTGSPELCDGNYFRFVPNPDYCFRFYFCNVGTAVPYECAPDTIFSEEIQGCIDGDWVTCMFYATTVTTIITDEPISTTTTEEPFTITTTTGDTTIDTERPSTTTTTQYISTTTSTLPDTPTTTTTQYISSSTTTTESGPEITTPTTTTISSQRPTGPPELCIGNNFRFIPDPDYCFRYYLCMFGVALPGECDPDKIFSEKWRGCVLGDWETCTPINPFVQLS